MRFSLALAFTAVCAVVSAQTGSTGSNPFSVPTSGYAFTAGTATTVTWTPTTSGTVTIQLRQGPSSSLGSATVLAANIPNSGSFTFTPPASTVQGSDYALEIVDDTNKNNVNYTPLFTITSNVKSSAAASSTAAESTSASSAASSTAAASTTAESTTLATRTPVSKTSSAASATTASASASATQSASGAGPVMKLSGGLVVMALGMFAL